MKSVSALVLSTLWLLAGCSQSPTSLFECDSVRLEVSGRVEPGGTYVAAVDPAIYYSIDFEARQVLIEAKIVSVSRNEQALLGIQWWPGNGLPLDPVRVQDTSPKPVPITLGFGFGTGSSRGGSAPHGPNCTCPECRAAGSRRTSSGGGFGIGIPVTLGGDHQVTSVRTTFDLPGEVQLDQSYLMVLVALGREADGKVLTQPILLPVITAPTTPTDGEVTENPSSGYVTVRDGDRLDFSGLTRTEGEEITSEVPALGDLPLLNRLFKSDSLTTRNKDLIIFVRPHVILQSDE